MLIVVVRNLLFIVCDQHTSPMLYWMDLPFVSLLTTVEHLKLKLRELTICWTISSILTHWDSIKKPMRLKQWILAIDFACVGMLPRKTFRLSNSAQPLLIAETVLRMSLRCIRLPLRFLDPLDEVCIRHARHEWCWLPSLMCLDSCVPDTQRRQFPSRALPTALAPWLCFSPLLWHCSRNGRCLRIEVGTECTRSCHWYGQGLYVKPYCHIRSVQLGLTAREIFGPLLPWIFGRKIFTAEGNTL